MSLMEKNPHEAILQPRVGVAVLILNKRNEVLLMLRICSPGAGEWGLPSGKQELYETVLETARREIEEETGLKISRFEFIGVCDQLNYWPEHHTAIGFLAHHEGVEPENREPHNHSEIRWFPINDLPGNLFESTAVIIQNYKDNVYYRSTR